jgi:hypothetical protein
VVVVDLVDAPVPDVDGLEGGRFALAAVVADPVDADDDPVGTDGNELGRADAVVSGSLLEFLP